MLQEHKIHFLQITKSKLQQMNYSKNTEKTYIHYLDEFLSSTKSSPTKLSNKDLEEYITSYNYSSVSQQNQVISSLKFFWVRVMGKTRLRIDFRRPRKEKKLPRIINAEEAAVKILSIENKKHKAILALGLSCGLRVSEVVNLKIKDIDSSRNVIHIKNAKGRKDRIVPLSDTLLKVLRDYFREYRPEEYLFNGQKSDKYSVSSCNKIVKRHLGLDKHYHLLRHSALTSMLETGSDIRVIQVAAGHSSPNTTSGYLHVSTKFLSQIQTPI